MLLSLNQQTVRTRNRKWGGEAFMIFASINQQGESLAFSVNLLLKTTTSLEEMMDVHLSIFVFFLVV